MVKACKMGIKYFTSTFFSNKCYILQLFKEENYIDLDKVVLNKSIIIINESYKMVGRLYIDLSLQRKQVS